MFNCEWFSTSKERSTMSFRRAGRPMAPQRCTVQEKRPQRKMPRKLQKFCTVRPRTTRVVPKMCRPKKAGSYIFQTFLKSPWIKKITPTAVFPMRHSIDVATPSLSPSSYPETRFETKLHLQTPHPFPHA